MNKADQDCGTSFAWVTLSIGPQSGWMTGWAICTTGILVVGSLADVAAYSFFDLIGATGLQDSVAAVTGFAVVLIVVMTAICVWSASGRGLSRPLSTVAAGSSSRAPNGLPRSRVRRPWPGKA